MVLQGEIFRNKPEGHIQVDGTVCIVQLSHHDSISNQSNLRQRGNKRLAVGQIVNDRTNVKQFHCTYIT